MEQTLTPPAAPAFRTRVDGWTAETQHAFIEALARTGCVRQAAALVGRAVSGVYRLRARSDAHAFRAAWDAALGLAYARLSEMAMDRVSNGLEQRTYDPDGNLVQRKIVHNDRLLMFLLDHHKPPAARVYYHDGKTPSLMDPPSRDDAYGAALDALEAAPAGAGIELPPKPADDLDRSSDLTDDQLVNALKRGGLCSEKDRAEIDELERRWAAGESFDDLLTAEEQAEFGGDEEDDLAGAPSP